MIRSAILYFFQLISWTIDVLDRITNINKNIILQNLERYDKKNKNHSNLRIFLKNQWRTVDFFNSTVFSKLYLNGIRSTNYMNLCIGVGMFLICDPPLPILFFCFGLCFFFFYVFVHNFLFSLSYNFLLL